MHELIQELKEKSVVEYPMGFDGVKYVFSPELFAELIVRECAKFMDENSGYSATNGCWFPEPEDMLKHFGVEVPEPKTQGIDLNDPSWRKLLGLNRRVLTPSESAAFISKITGEDLAPLYSTNNQRSITEVYDIDGVKFHVNYLDEGEMIVEEML
jgi:hypothetical protein